MPAAGRRPRCPGGRRAQVAGPSRLPEHQRALRQVPALQRAGAEPGLHGALRRRAQGDRGGGADARGALRWRPPGSPRLEPAPPSRPSPAVHFALALGTHGLHVVHLAFGLPYLVPIVGAAAWAGPRVAIVLGVASAVAYAVHARTSWAGEPMENASQFALAAVFLFVSVVSASLVAALDPRPGHTLSSEGVLRRRGLLVTADRDVVWPGLWAPPDGRRASPSGARLVPEPGWWPSPWSLGSSPGGGTAGSRLRYRAIGPVTPARTSVARIPATPRQRT